MNAEIKTNVIKRNGEEVAFDLAAMKSHRNMCAIVIKEN